MKGYRVLVSVVVTTLLAVATGLTYAQEPGPERDVGIQAALGTAFTYQGRLTDSGSPVNGSCEMVFRLYDHAVEGSQVGEAIARTVPLAGGLFTVSLDFGSNPFRGDARWLGIQVKCLGDSDYTSLGRQELSAAPYALYALRSPWTGLLGVPAELADGDDTGADWHLNGNTGTTPGTHVLGTTDPVSLTLVVSGTPALRLEPHATGPNLIGGYSGNSVTANVYGATIGGGGFSGYANRVTDSYGIVGGGVNNQAGDEAGTTDDATLTTVGGGGHNTASGSSATVGGGYSNEASGDSADVGGGSHNTASGPAATVGGGYTNEASNHYATVGGGYDTTASGFSAAVGGGYFNTASGDYATIPGGALNRASGNFSFAAGRRAKASADGCFVWGDSTSADVTCSNSNLTLFRSSGGFYIYTNAGLTSAAYLAAGSGTWASLSDRNAKENVKPVDPQLVLEGVAQLPVNTWNYTSQDPAIRHMGPMAQDFNGAFGLGEDEAHIGTVDADGVALAAIQGLYEISQEQAAHIEELETENAKLRAHVDDLAGRLEALELAVTTGKGAGPNAASSSPFQASLLPGAGMLVLAVALAWGGRRRGVLR